MRTARTNSSPRGFTTVTAVVAIIVFFVALVAVVVHRGTEDHMPESQATDNESSEQENKERPSVLREFTALGQASTYRIFTEGVDFSKPVGVVMRLHGDGDNETTQPEGVLSDLAAVAADHNMILVAPRSPDTAFGAVWWQELDIHVAWLKQLVQEVVLRIKGVDPNDIWWMGYSGGSEILGYGILPFGGELVTGGALMMAGGGAPERLPEGSPLSQAPSDLPLSWVVGTLDDGSTSPDGFNAIQAARSGEEFYRDLGFDQTSLEFIPGIDHYGLPQAESLDEFLDAKRG